MRRVSGQILVHETGAPVPNLVVVATLGHIERAAPTLTAAPVGHARAGGSTTSGQRGEFALELPEIREEEHPQLTLTVLPPAVGGTPDGHDPLHSVTRHAIGETEAFVLYLPLALLRRHQIPPFGPPMRADPAEALGEQITRQVEQTAAIRQALQPEIQRQLRQRRATSTQLRRLLGGLPRTRTLSDRFVPPDADPLPVAAAARAAGIQRLASVDTGGGRVRTTTHMLQEFGLEFDPDGTPTTDNTVSQDQLDLLLPTGGVMCIRVVDPLAACRAQQQVKSLPPNPPVPASPPAPPAGGPASEDTVSIPVPAPQASSPPLADIIAAELATLVAAIGDEALAMGVRPDSASIAGDLAVELTPGPADLPATHDFHSLQIAWEDVWTASVDEALVAKMAKAYDGIVEIVDWTAVNPDLSEIKELDEFLRLLREAIEVAAGVGGDGGILKAMTGAVEGAVDLVKIETTTEPEALPEPLARLRRLLEGIAAQLAEDYRFDVFQPCTHNFGLITTYRQIWRPLAYQVGEMVGSIPLTPGEKRTYSTKKILKTERSQKEIEKALSTRHGESTETTRVDAEIVRKASYSTNFTMNASGGFSVGVFNAQVGAAYGSNQAAESTRVKKDFHEAVRKSAQEYRNERSIEISLEESTTQEFGETGEIRNDNNELTVTYLFYELERRFEVSEQLHRVTPVVLVAFDVPPPDGIIEPWLLAHEWILRRVLLDDRLLPALDALTDTFAGDELSVEVLRTQWETQIAVVRELRHDAGAQTTAQRLAREELRHATQMYTSGGGGGLFGKVGDFLTGGDDGDAEAIEAARHAAQKALEWAEADLALANERLAGASGSLQQATEAYTAALERRLNRRVALDQLRLHVKQNILFYMQAIWLHEPPDQRYLRIYNKEIEWPSGADPYYTVVKASQPNPAWKVGLPGDPIEVEIVIKVNPPVLAGNRLLDQVADIDNLLGFKGNYAIFPLKVPCPVTDYMAESFFDSYLGVHDPDEQGELPTPAEAVEIARCAWDDATADEREKITTWLIGVLGGQSRAAEVIVVPTGQLFVEALPGTHPVLEDFKLRHRQLDVRKVRAEVLRDDLEALRYAARIAADQLGDPEIQTQILVPEGSPVTVAAPTAPNP